MRSIVYRVLSFKENSSRYARTVLWSKHSVQVFFERSEKFNQAGIAGILVLVLLLTGVGVGTYLVQTRTNLLPKAAGKTTACDGQSLAGQSFQTREDFRAIYGDQAAEKWVEEHERDIGGCKDSGSSTGNNSSNTNNNSGNNNRPGNQNNNQRPNNTNNSTNTTNPANGSQQLSATQAKCAADSENGFYDTKVAARYTQYLAIVNGIIKEACVKADLGLEPQITASAKGKSKKERVFLCAGKDNSSSKADLIWRVDSEEQGGKPLETDYNGSLERQKLLNTENVKKAKQMLGL